MFDKFPGKSVRRTLLDGPLRARDSAWGNRGEIVMKQTSLGKAALAVSVFACTTMLSVGWTEQKGVSLSIERAQAQMADPYTTGRRAAARAAGRGRCRSSGRCCRSRRCRSRSDRRLLRRRRPLRLLRRPGGYIGAAYYSGPGVWSPGYATQNGIICQPGTLVPPRRRPDAQLPVNRRRERRPKAASLLALEFVATTNASGDG